MKNRKLAIMLVCLVLMLPTLAFADASVTVTDMMGRELTLAQPATRIVALMPADCEILFAIGAGDALVGRGAYCDYPSELGTLPEVQSGGDTNIEQIIALEPQVVLMSAMAQTVEQVAALEKAGIAVAVSNAQDIGGVYEAIRMAGALTGKTGEAESLVLDMQSGFAEIARKAEAACGAEEKTVYFEASPLQYGLWTAGSGTFMDELAAMLRLTNAFADVNGWGEISAEQVIQRDPNYIVTTAMDMGEGQTPEEEILSRDGWQQLEAIRENHVFTLNADEISRPGPRLLDAADALYRFVYEHETEAAAVPAA